MKKILTLAIASLSVFGAISPAHSGLGSAASKSSESGYEAWCGKRGNDCKVTFADGKISVDGKHSVNFEDITYITRNREEFDFDYQYTFGIEYLEEGMTDPEFAEILFMHTGTANKFWRDLQRACRKCKNRDATQVEVNIKE